MSDIMRLVEDADERVISGKGIDLNRARHLYKRIVESDEYWSDGGYERDTLVVTAQKLLQFIVPAEEEELAGREEPLLCEPTLLDKAREKMVSYAGRDVSNLDDDEYSDYMAAKNDYSRLVEKELAREKEAA